MNIHHVLRVVFLRAQAVRIVLVGIACRAVRAAGEPIPRVIAIRFAVMRAERTGRVVGVGIRHRAADRNRRKLPGVVVCIFLHHAVGVRFLSTIVQRVIFIQNARTIAVCDGNQPVQAVIRIGRLRTVARFGQHISVGIVRIQKTVHRAAAARCFHRRHAPCRIIRIRGLQTVGVRHALNQAVIVIRIRKRLICRDNALQIPVGRICIGLGAAARCDLLRFAPRAGIGVIRVIRAALPFLRRIAQRAVGAADFGRAAIG